MSKPTFITQNSQWPFEGGGGGGVFEQWPFLWKKWDFCSEVKKEHVEIKCRRQFVYRLCQHLESFINILITNVNVNIYIKNYSPLRV